MSSKVVSLFLLFLFASISFSQQDQSLIKEGAPNIFIDCSYCDLNYIKEQIPIVNYVRDRKEADIHILFSYQTTGSGGTETSLFYIGQRMFAGLNDTVKFSTIQSESKDEQRAKLVKTIKLGLARYIGKSKIADQMTISYTKPQAKTETQNDDWDFWLFRTSLNTYFYGQESTGYLYLNGSISASRVTEELKLSFSLSNSYSENSYSYNNNDFISLSRSTSLNASIIKSFTDKWSWGFWTGAYKSTYSNIDLSYNISPGIEYNFFPYSESNRRQLRAGYKISYIQNKYIKETVYFKTEETLWSQTANLTLSLIEQWGSLSFSLYGANFLYDFNKYGIGVDSQCSLNLVKGLSLNLYGSYSKIRNQITLPRAGATLEEVLLQRTQLETGYYFYGSIGFSYSFGSIYNNIVNPRFGNSAGGYWPTVSN
ncbi:MAG: hypothetical protein WC879_06525 [Melioribacteraceae bacterium]